MFRLEMVQVKSDNSHKVSIIENKDVFKLLNIFTRFSNILKFNIYQDDGMRVFTYNFKK